MSDEPKNPAMEIPPADAPGIEAADKPNGEAQAGGRIRAVGADGRPKGRGRHPKDCPCGFCNKGKRRNVETSTVREKSDSARRESFDATLARKSFDAILGGIDSAVVAKIERVAGRIDKNIARELAERAALSPAEREAIDDLAVTLAEKYGLTSRFTPEILLGATLALYAARVGGVMVQLRRMETALNESRPPAK